MALTDLIYVDATGLHYPDYDVILATLKDEYRAIYGSDVYLEADSQDGQWLAVNALALFDTIQVAASVYNSFSPATAQSDALSRNVKLNGLRRSVATYSQVDLAIGGTVGTTITDGQAQDTLGQKWNLPSSVVIPISGTITVTATAADIGAIAAAPNTITKIVTVTLGWQTVNNVAAATVGAPVETDAALRRRQALSVALPALSIFDGLVGAIASLIGVTRIKGYENDGDTVDANGIPAHAISMVVEGGISQEIGEVIALKKTPGTGTYGTTSVSTIDSQGLGNVINFYRPTVATISVEVSLTALTGYTTAVGEAIKAAVAADINGLDIGAIVRLTKLYLPANLSGDPSGDTYNVTLLRTKKNAGAFGTSDITLGFNESAMCSAATDVTLIVS